MEAWFFTNAASTSKSADWMAFSTLPNQLKIFKSIPQYKQKETLSNSMDSSEKKKNYFQFS